MSSSDIYKIKESPFAKKTEEPVRRRRQRKSFDEASDKDIAGTHRRRSRNSGFRRFQHRMKDPKYCKKFWILLLGSAGFILVVLIVWDRFLRYPKLPVEKTPDAYHAVAD
jgi:hypothetical protein